MDSSTVLKMSSVPRTTTSKISCAVPSNTFPPAALISMGGSVYVCSSIFDTTPRINSGLMKCFDDSGSTKS